MLPTSQPTYHKNLPPPLGSLSREQFRNPGGSFPSVRESVVFTLAWGKGFQRESSVQMSLSSPGWALQCTRNMVAPLMVLTVRTGPGSLPLQGCTQLCSLCATGCLSFKCLSSLSVGLSFPNTLAHILTASLSTISHHARVPKFGYLISAITDYPSHSVPLHSVLFLITNSWGHIKLSLTLQFENTTVEDLQHPSL